MVAAADITGERQLAGLCLALGAREIGGWSAAETALAEAAVPAAPAALPALRSAIRAGADPLGDGLLGLRAAPARRAAGATYTPAAVVDAMVAWADRSARGVRRVVDPGAGSARFLRAAGRRFRRADLIGVERDPLAAMIGRANLATAGLAGRARILVADYRDVELPGTGPTLFVGNPPYVRHHQIEPAWKSWLAATARAHGLPPRRLAGLHVHFFLATLVHASPGDAGCFVTAAEWLDVNYGALVRRALAGPLGLERIDLIDPSAEVFAGTMTTAAISCFRVGSAPRSVRIRQVASAAALGDLSGGRRVSATRLSEPRWSALVRPRRRPSPELIELGELCRVHRGQVTGANKVWIRGPSTPPLPAAFARPAITRARELFEAGGALRSTDALRAVIALPDDLDELPPAERAEVDAFLAWARARGAHESYVARHRSPWWAVVMPEPAPILASYMARRPPVFVRNRAGASHLNIAHGLYPRQPLSPAILDALAGYLSGNASLEDGRTYAGGLTKFEPREMERLLVPRPERLA